MKMMTAATMITSFFNIVSGLCKEYQTAGNVVLIAVSLLILGSQFLIGDDETKARARKRIPYIIIGAMIVISAFNIAGNANTELAF